MPYLTTSKKPKAKTKPWFSRLHTTSSQEMEWIYSLIQHTPRTHTGGGDEKVGRIQQPKNINVFGRLHAATL